MILQIACNSTGMLFVCRTWAHKRGPTERYSERENSKRFSRGRPLAKKMFPLSPPPLPSTPRGTKTCVILAPPRGKLVTTGLLHGRSHGFFARGRLIQQLRWGKHAIKLFRPTFCFPVDREGERERERELSAFEYTRGTNDKRGKRGYDSPFQTHLPSSSILGLFALRETGRFPLPTPLSFPTE